MFAIDRIEGNLAVCENLDTGEIINLPTTKFPDSICEGELFEIENQEIVMVRPLEKEAHAKRISEKMKSLWI